MAVVDYVAAAIVLYVVDVAAELDVCNYETNNCHIDLHSSSLISLNINKKK